jgi:hypothetical protein
MRGVVGDVPELDFAVALPSRHDVRLAIIEH